MDLLVLLVLLQDQIEAFLLLLNDSQGDFVLRCSWSCLTRSSSDLDAFFFRLTGRSPVRRPPLHPATGRQPRPPDPGRCQPLPRPPDPDCCRALRIATSCWPIGQSPPGRPRDRFLLPLDEAVNVPAACIRYSAAGLLYFLGHVGLVVMPACCLFLLALHHRES